MSICTKCGESVNDSKLYCDSCGANITNQTLENGIYVKSDIEKNKSLAMISYIGIFSFISLLVAPQSKYARFHSNQGIVLFIFINIFYNIFRFIEKLLKINQLEIIFIIYGIFALMSLVFIIIGITNAARGKLKKLPLIGSIKIVQ